MYLHLCPVLLFSSISKRMNELISQSINYFLLISPFSPSLSLLSCPGPCQEQGWGGLTAALTQPDPSGGSPHSAVHTGAFALVLGVLAR